ncbi:MAG TPA: tryptophan--tRNA ligase [Methanosarcinales archaeon]|nr:tryptophan--tRNA ligase [Methanosarcinales archaeon]
MTKKITINPWGSSVIEDYSKLFEDFGIEKFEFKDLPKAHRFHRRKIIFGHRGYDLILSAIKNKKPWAVLSGFMPSGKVHLGHKMVMEEIIWHQQIGGSAFAGIADMEAHAVRGMSWEKCKKIGVKEYLVSLVALGFDLDKGYLYFQSKNSKVKDLEFELAIKANFSELSAIYGFSGETSVAHMQSALVQSADILMPQLKDFGGPKPVVIPVGADQDPHIRFTRGLANKMNLFRVEHRGDHISVRGKSANEDLLKEIATRLDGDIKVYSAHIDIFGNNDSETFEEIDSITREVELEFGGYAFVPPSSTYHRFSTGLTSGKMSSSIPESYIALTDDPKEAYNKVKKAITGGRVSLEEQKRLGGEPDKCSVYELLMFHLIEDDKEIQEIYIECKSGKRMCGYCKKFTAELMQKFLIEHQQKREIAKQELEKRGMFVD